LVAVASIAVLSAIGPSSTAASVTVGQVSPGVPTSCSNSFDFVQHSTPDNSYAMPATGVITSWTHRSQSGVGQTPTLKIFRKIGDPGSYQQVAHDGPHPIAANTLLTFPASIPVQAGDLLGLTGAGGAVNIGCSFTGPGDVSGHTPNLADGGSGVFALGSADHRINASAVLNPTNTFTLGSVTRNKKKGTATLSLTLPNPGDLAVSGTGATTALVAGASSAVSAGATSLRIKATGKKRKKLSSTGKVKLTLAITYTPTGGDPSSQSMKVKLRKKAKLLPR
jgi:hypothetical protein